MYIIFSIPFSALNGTTAYIYDKNGNLIQEIGPDERVTTYAYDVENRLKAVMEGERLLMAALYDGDGNRVFRMEYGEKTEGSFTNGTEKEENTASITEETEGEAGRSGSPLIPHAWETEEEQEEVTETRNNIFWYSFGQGLIQGLTTVPGYLSQWLHEHWEYILDSKGDPEQHLLVRLRSGAVPGAYHHTRLHWTNGVDSYYHD